MNSGESGPTFVLGLIGADARPGRERAPADLPLEFVLADATCIPSSLGAAIFCSPLGVMFFADLRFRLPTAQGAAERRPSGVRVLARAATKPMDDDRKGGSVQARSASP